MPLAEAALARPCALDALASSFQRARPRPGEATRGRAHRRARSQDRRGRPPHLAQGRRQGDGYLVPLQQHRQHRGATRGLVSGRGSARRAAAALLAWQSPASGARCLALAAHVRALADDDLGDLLVELPTGRFDAFLEAALNAHVRAGEAA